MKILQLCKYYAPVLGGIELVEKTITKAHCDLGDQVIIVAFADSQKTEVGEFDESIYLVKQDVFFKSAPINFTFLFEFKKIIIRHGISRVYVHLPNPFMHEVLKYSKGFLKKSNIEIVAVYHSDIVNQKLLGKLYDHYFSLSKNLYQYWICSSEKLWNSSPILSTIDKLKMRIIPFCTEGNLEFKKRKKFTGKLLAIGRLVPYKGFEFLIKTINKTNYELNIIGDGPEGLKLEGIAGPNVILHKRLSDENKKMLFNQCDALVVSSINRAEAYGMIIVEAFESGMPVIASNLKSGVTYLVQHEKTGLVFETENSEELIQALKRLAGDDHLYQEISSNTREFFDSVLSYPHFRDKIKNFKEYF